ncbi:MAG: acetolactate synthase large subunit [Bacteroidota bacterium]
MKIGKKQKASDLFVHCLEALGVEYVFTVPGEETIDVVDSIRQSEHIKLVLLRHEQGAGFMAANYGRLTGKVGVCLVTLGPGTTNVMTSVAYAHLGGMPMLTITGQKSIKERKQGFFQLIDAVGIMKPITKVSEQITSKSAIPSLLQRCFHQATIDKPGAVHLDFPEDIAQEIGSFLPPIPLPYYTPQLPNKASLELALSKIQKASHPLFILGPACKNRNIPAAISKLIQDKSIYFITTQMGKGVVNEHSALYLGTTAISEGDDVHQVMQKADLIITLGYDQVEKPAFLMTQVDVEVLHIHDHNPQPHLTYFPQSLLIGDMAYTLNYLSNHLTSRFFPLFKQFKEEKNKKIQSYQRKEKNHTYLTPLSLVAVLQNVMPEQTTLALDNGLYKLFLTRNLVARDYLNLMLDNTLATMGAGLSTAITTKMIFPDRKVVAILGDGGFMMNAQELESATRLNIHLIILILQDDAYGMIGWKQKKMNMPLFGISFTNPNFMYYAKAHGCHGYEVNSPKELGQLLTTCLSKKKDIHLIKVPFSYEGIELVEKKT